MASRPAARQPAARQPAARQPAARRRAAAAASPQPAKKKVIVRIPGTSRTDKIERRYAYELEALDPVAAIVEVEASSEDDFARAAADADALITSWGFRIGRSLIERLEHCVVIGVGSVGVDMVDVQAATDAGIVVTNVPDVFIEEVADHTMALLLAMARRLRTMHEVAATGRWAEGRPILGRVPRLLGQTLGLVAFGNVARSVARRAQVFGLRVIAYDPYVSEVTMIEHGVEPVSLDELLERADYVSLHPLLNQETRHLIGAKQLRRMKETAILINCARGGSIDEQALVRALRKEWIAGAALDVLEHEPPAADNPLLVMPNVLLTPHVASSSTRMRPETRRRVGREVALVLSGRWPRSCVNPTVLPRVPLERWQPTSMERGPNR